MRLIFFKKFLGIKRNNLYVYVTKNVYDQLAKYLAPGGGLTQNLKICIQVLPLIIFETNFSRDYT